MVERKPLPSGLFSGREGLLTYRSRHDTTPTVVPHKPRRSELSAKNEQGEYATFVEALKTVLSVPHSALKTKLNAAKGSESRNLPLPVTQAVRVL
jgi:hypothetical protein